MTYGFVMLGATEVALYRAAHPTLWVVAFVGSIPVVAALVAGWPERSDAANRCQPGQD